MKSFFLSFSVLLLFTACQQIDLGDYTNTSSNDDTYEVNITSKSGESGVELPYPLTVYAVNEEGLVVSYVKNSESSATNSLSLSSGEYTLYAVAGADAGDSDIFDENVIIAEKGYFDAPIMQGKTNISVEEDDVDADLSLSYAVAAVDVTLNEIPTDVNTITVTIGKQYQTMPLDKKYTGETSATIDLTKQSDGTTWKSNTIYVFPGTSSNTTLTISSTSDSGESSYTITYGSALVAGKPYHFKGTYKSLEKTMSITCNIAANGWDEAIESSFDFGEGKENVQPPVVAGDIFYYTGDLPKAGTKLDGHFLAYVDETTSSGLLYSLKDCASVEKVAEYKEGTLEGWNVPTLQQYTSIKSQYTNIATFAKLVKDISGKNYPCNSDHRYYCTNGQGAFSWSSGDVNITANVTYHLRLVKPVTFKIQQ
jgi:hypothetical protein